MPVGKPFRRNPRRVVARGIVDSVGLEIVRKVFAEPQKGPRLALRNDIAQIERGGRHGVEIQILDFPARYPLRMAVREHDSGLVFYLVVPAHRPIGAYNTVVELLGVLGERNRPDNSEVYGKGIESVARGDVRSKARIEPSGVRPVPLGRVRPVYVRGHAHHLPDRHALVRLRAIGGEEVEEGELQAARPEIPAALGIRKFQSVGIISV